MQLHKLLILICLSVVFTVAQPEDQPAQNDSESKDQNSTENTPEQKDYSSNTERFLSTTYTQWALLFAGVAIGLSSTNAENIDNKCIAGSIKTVDSAWNVYYYMDLYMQTEDEVYMAWGVTYMVKGFEVAYNIDCSNIETEANEWLEEVYDWFTNLGNGGLGGEKPLAPLYYYEPIVN